jgi:cbb3-type cytochrome oxidase subunit 3
MLNNMLLDIILCLTIVYVALVIIIYRKSKRSV